MRGSEFSGLHISYAQAYSITVSCDRYFLCDLSRWLGGSLSHWNLVASVDSHAHHGCGTKGHSLQEPIGPDSLPPVSFYSPFSVRGGEDALRTQQHGAVSSTEKSEVTSYNVTLS